MIRSRRRVTRPIACSIGCIAVLAPSVVRASLPIFGGPEYSSTANTGATPITLGTPGHSAAEGYAIGSATTYDPSTSATATPILGYRWNTAGTVENLGNVPVAAPFTVSGDRHVTAIAPDHTAIGYAHPDVSSFSFPGTFPPADRAQFWDAANNVTTLAPLPPLSLTPVPVGASAYGMNRSHVIVGSSELNQFYGLGSYTNHGTHAVRWDSPTSPAVDLGSPSTYGGYASAQALFVNDAGNVAGTYLLYGPSGANLGVRAVRWAPGSTTPIPLDAYAPDANGFSNVYVNGQNAAGTVVGASERNASDLIANSARILSAVRWNAGGTALTGLGDLSHSVLFHVRSQAYGINDAGTTIGYSAVGGSGFGSGERAVRWEAGSSTPVTLDTFGVSSSGAATARGYAINSSGVAVGFSSRYNVSGTFVANCAAMWLNDATHTLVDLNSYLPAGSGWHLDSANDITTAGFISGTGTYDPPGSDAPYQRGFLILVPAAGTYGRGDANFDGSINFSDLLTLARNYGQSNPTQRIDMADFDLNGVVDFSDLLTLARNYGTSAATPDQLAALPGNVATDWALAQSLAPEPATTLVLISGSIAAATRPRRRRNASTSRRVG